MRGRSEARWLLVFLSCVPCWRARGQTLLAAPIPPGDAAVFGSEGRRDESRCEVSPGKPQIGFDLRFHSGYTLAVPLEKLAGAGNGLRVLMRVAPLDDPRGARYFAGWVRVPPLGSKLHGEAQFTGEFDVGPGRYSVEWLLGAGEKRLCSARWELEAKTPAWLRDGATPLAANAIAECPKDLFRQAPPVRRDRDDRLLRVKLLVNFSPCAAGKITLSPEELEAIVSIMRTVVREPRLGRFSLVAFSLREEKVLFRQTDVPVIDFEALGSAVKALRFGTIDYRRLTDRMSGARFLEGLLTEDAGRRQSFDAIIIIGPKAMLETNIPRQALLSDGWPSCPVFYLNYNSDPRGNPWRDAIGAALKVYHGLEYAIVRPSDLASALSDMRARLYEGRPERGFAPAGQQSNSGQ